MVALLYDGRNDGDDQIDVDDHIAWAHLTKILVCGPTLPLLIESSCLALWNPSKCVNDLINTCKWSWAGVDRRMWRNGVIMAGNSEFIKTSTSDPHTSSGLHGLFCFDVLTVTLVWCCIRSPLSTSLGTSHLLPTRSCPPQIYALRIYTKTCGMPRWHT